jgi:hypothetical protein
MANRKLNVVLGVETSEFEKGLRSAEAKLDKFGKNISKVGENLTKNLTLPIVAFGALSVKAFTVQEDAERKLAAAIAATGGEVDANMQRFKSFASELQGLTVVGDETTLGLLQLATAQGLNADQSERAAKNAIAMQSAFGVNADAAIKMTAALETGNASMLKRYIPALKDIKDDSEAAAKAQEILTQAFEISKAETQTTSGQIKQLQNSFGDFMEEIGGVIAVGLTPLIEKLRSVTQVLLNLSPEFKKKIVIVGLVVAAIGPLLFIVGKFIALGGTLIKVARGIGVAFTFMTSPIGLTIAAVAAVVAAIVIAYNKFEGFRRIVNGLIDAFTEFIKILGEGGAALFRGFKAIFEGRFKDAANDFKEALIKTNPVAIAISEGKRLGAAFVTGYEDGTDRLSGVFDKLKASVTGGGASAAVPSMAGFGGIDTGEESTGSGVTKETLKNLEQISKYKPIEILKPGTVQVQRQSNEAFKSGTDDLNRYKEAIAANVKEIDNINKRQELSLQQTQLATAAINSINAISNTLTNTLVSAFDKGTNVIQNLIGGLKQLVIQLVKAVAQAAIFAAIMALIPGGSVIGKALGASGSLVGKGSFSKNLFGGLLGFASGGLVTGPTLGMIGEGRGTSLSNPEVVAPLDKLKSILQSTMGGGEFVASTRLQGSDLLLVVERATRNRGR